MKKKIKAVYDEKTGEVYSAVLPADGSDPIYSRLSTGTEVAEKQNKVDDALETASKEVVGAINEVNTKVGNLTGAFVWKGKFDALPVVDTYEAGDVVSVESKEYVLTVVEGAKTWVEFGDEANHVTKDFANATYLKKAAGAVGTENLADKAVTTEKLADRVLTLLQGSVPVSKLSSLFGTEITLNLVERANTGHTVYDIEESGLVEVRAFEESWKGLFGTLEGCRFAANILFQGQYSQNIVKRQYIFVREQKKSENNTYTAIVNLVRPGGDRTRDYHLYEISIHLREGYADVLKVTLGDDVVLNLNKGYAGIMNSYVDLNTIGGSDPNKVVYFQYNDTSKGLLEGVGRTYLSPTSPGDTSWFDGITFDGKYKIHAEAFRSDTPDVTVTENGPKDLEALKTTVSGLETTVAQQQVSLAQTSNNLKLTMQAIQDIMAVMVTALNLTEDTASNKLAYDNLLLDKSTDPPQYIPLVSISCTYKNDYAGTLHKIGTDWFGQLVKNTNNYEDCICIKLAADGTVTEGTTSLKVVNAKLDTIIG